MGATLHLPIFHLLLDTYSNHRFYPKHFSVVPWGNFLFRLPRNSSTQNAPMFLSRTVYRPRDMADPIVCLIPHPLYFPEAYILPQKIRALPCLDMSIYLYSFYGFLHMYNIALIVVVALSRVWCKSSVRPESPEPSRC